MEILQSTVVESPRGPAFRQLRCQVAYDDRAIPREEYWFEVDASHFPDLRSSGEPWLACLLPLAATLGEPLICNVPVDTSFLENIRELLRVWTAWYPELRSVPIRAPIASRTQAGGRTAALFSGGVDSFFTALRHRNGYGTPRTESIDDLLFVHGFDIPVCNKAAFAAVYPILLRAAEDLGYRLVVVSTNLRQTRWAATSWTRLSHGAALAAVGHALGPAYRTLLIPSSAGYGDLRFWGSHPLTDPMLSSSCLRVVHDGPAFTRIDKTAYIAQSEIALRALRVCWRSDSGWNCGECSNCYRTMLALEILNVLQLCATFDHRRLDIRQAGRIFCQHSYDVRQFGYVRELAARGGRTDIVRAVDLSLRRSRALQRRIRLVRKTYGWPLLRRVTERLERRLLKGWLV